MALKGVDVSYAQYGINWTTVKSQIDFAILRSSFGLDLPSQIDNMFFTNANACVKNNIPFGIYHFGYFIDETTAKDEADFAIRLANEYKSYVKFIALDLEEDSQAYANRMGKKPNWGKCAKIFLDRIKAAGYTPVIYTNVSWMQNQLGGYNNMKAYKVWFAGPGFSNRKYNAAIWQYSWTGKINGISGEVDMNYLYDESLIKKSTTAEKKSTTTQTNTSTKVNDKDKFLKQAATYIGKNGYYVCQTKLKLGAVYDWCCFAVSSIMKDCGFIPKYQPDIYGVAPYPARYGDGKTGTWFKKGSKNPQPGDLIFFFYDGCPVVDKYSCSHIGIVEKVNGNILTTLEGNVQGYGSDWAGTSTFARCTRYINDNSVHSFFRPWWDGNKNITTTSSSTSTSTKTNSSKIDVYYQVYAGGRWLPEVKNLEDYAGLENKPIQGIYMRPSKGHLKYRVKTTNSNSYLPWVKDKQDYAGILGKNIAWVQATLEDVDGYQVEYRVSTTASNNYLPWVQNYNTVNDDGYAGGGSSQSIDKLQIKITKK